MTGGWIRADTWVGPCKKWRAPVALAALAAATRVPFTGRYLFNLDSVQYALATESYDITLHQPHPPGYFLYVMMGRAARLIFSDANTAFVFISILFSALAVAAVYLLAEEAFDRESALAASLLAIASPVFWFHGEAALSYMPEAAMSALTALLCLKLLNGESRYWWLAAASLAVAGGIRQNTMAFLMPLWLYSIRGLGARRVLASFAVFGALVLSWFAPMVHMTGGYDAYRAALKAHWLNAAWHGIGLHWLLFNAKYIGIFLLGGLGLGLAPAIMLAWLRARGRVGVHVNVRLAAFFAVWLLPPFLFHLVVFTHPGVPGYTLVYLVGLFVLAGKALTKTAAAAAGMRAPVLARAVMAAVAIGNAAIFLFQPYAFFRKGIEDHDRVLAGYIGAVRKNFGPAETVLVGTERFIFSYRHAMYYLPEYIVYDDVIMDTPEGPRLFAGKGGKTEKARRIEARPGTRYYVYFMILREGDEEPLPEGARTVSAGNGCRLAYFTDFKDLGGIRSIGPLLAPGYSRKVFARQDM